MKKINDILTKITAEGLAGSVQQAAEYARIEHVLRQILVEEGYDDFDCRVRSLTAGELFVVTDDSSTCSRLRQMQRVLLARLQPQFTSIKRLRFGIQL
ncbi:MAG: DciA family protein [Gammaproteobacteria bacterium WSBS_2016_MAG_OTU1]